MRDSTDITCYDKRTHCRFYKKCTLQITTLKLSSYYFLTCILHYGKIHKDSQSIKGDDVVILVHNVASYDGHIILTFATY